MRSVAEDGAAPATVPAWVRPDDPALLALRSYAAGQARAFLDAHPGTAHPVPAATRALTEPAERLSGLLRVFAGLVEAEWAQRLAGGDLVDAWPEVSGKRWRRWLAPG
jgi:hypothetical protein